MSLRRDIAALRHRTWAPAAATALALALSGCAGFGGPINEGDEISPEERRLRDIESQLEQNTRRIDNIGDAQLSGGPMALADEMRALRGEVERLSNTVERLRQRSTSRLDDMERRIAGLEGGERPSARSGGDTPDVTTGSLGGGSSQPAERDPKEEQAYLKAFDLLKQGNYSDAILGFENVVSNWPDGRYADTALYWAGESHYVQRNYEKALDKFDRLLEDHPGSSRKPDALLKAGFALEELERPEDARKRFQAIVDNHGDSSAANLAKQRLQRLSQR
ncbi:tol-pal system protein YbgF [Algiphilus aromaticivorans]|jgi:tol-pal system protein YbgF|uniref:tol-pal system protein YbgF n=1 Tax=Algiphilus aromaticivorans TaxID=382454 RepID=UPI0006945752|nr:tol-pal system protein YbgF [Algiphilus aromaticivorans]